MDVACDAAGDRRAVHGLGPAARRAAATVAVMTGALLGALAEVQAQAATTCQGAQATGCTPAIAGPWRHAGGSRTHRIEVSDQASLEELRAALEAHLRTLYGRNACAPARISHAGRWRDDDSTAELQRERMVTLHEVGFLHGDECTLVGGATAFHTTRERRFRCEAGRAGPFVGPQGDRWCGPVAQGN